MCGEVEVLLFSKALFRKHQHRKIPKRLLDGRDLARSQRLREIAVANLRSEAGRYRIYSYGHRE